MKIKSFLSYIDLFECKYDFIVRDNKTRYSSLQGQIYSLLILIGSLSYGISQIVQWQLGQLSPTVTSFNQKSEKLEKFYLEEFGLHFRIEISDSSLIQLAQKYLHIKFKSNNSILWFYSNVTSQNQIEYSLFSNISKSQSILQNDKFEVQLTFCNKENQCASDDELELLLVQNIAMFHSDFKQWSINYQNSQIINYSSTEKVWLSKNEVRAFGIYYNKLQLEIDYGYPLRLKRTINQIIKYSDLIVIQNGQDFIIYFIIDQQQSQQLQKYKGLLQIGYFQLTSIEERVIVQHQQVLDLIILSFGLLKMLISFGNISIKYFTKYQLKIIICNKLESIRSKYKGKKQTKKEINRWYRNKLNKIQNINVLFKIILMINKTQKEILKQIGNIQKYEIQNDQIKNEEIIQQRSLRNSKELNNQIDSQKIENCNEHIVKDNNAGLGSYEIQNYSSTNQFIDYGVYY